jgi:hypothetical protein
MQIELTTEIFGNGGYGNGASEGIRTLDTHVGNVMLYQAELRSLPNRRGDSTGTAWDCKPGFDLFWPSRPEISANGPRPGRTHGCVEPSSGRPRTRLDGVDSPSVHRPRPSVLPPSPRNRRSKHSPAPEPRRSPPAVEVAVAQQPQPRPAGREGEAAGFAHRRCGSHSL